MNRISNYKHQLDKGVSSISYRNDEVNYYVNEFSGKELNNKEVEDNKQMNDLMQFVFGDTLNEELN